MRSLLPALPRAAWIVLAGDAASAVGSGLTLPFLLVYLHQARGLGLGSAGLAVAMIALAGLAGNPLGGSGGDRFGPRATLVAGLLAAAAGSLALVDVASAPQAFAACGLLGLGAAVSWPALDTLLASLVAPEQRAGAFGLRHATLNVGLGVGALIAAVLVAGASPNALATLYALDAASFVIFAFAVLALTPPTRGERESTPGRWRSLAGDRVFLRVWALTALLVGAGVAQYAAAFPAYATEVAGLDARWLSLALAANTVTVVAAQLLVLRLLKRRRRSTALALVGALWALAWTIALVSSAPALLIAAMVLLGLGETALIPTVPALVNQLAPEGLRGRYNGALALAFTCGFVFGPLLAAGVLAAGLGRVLPAVLAVACALAALGARRLRLPPGCDLVSV